MQVGMVGGEGAGAAATGREHRLIHAAHEFEGQMLKELLKPLTASDGLTGEESDGGAGGVLGEFASEALGQALSRQGGFGIADRILGELSRSGPVPATAGVTGDRHFDTGVSAFKSLR